MRRGIVIVLVLSMQGCLAWGNADWRRESHNTDVHLLGAGDGECSRPAPWPNFKSCLIHDAPYEVARKIRCTGGTDEKLVSEQARMVSDYTLAANMAADGYGEWVIETYRLAVRYGGWWTWHFSSCQ